MKHARTIQFNAIGVAGAVPRPHTVIMKFIEGTAVVPEARVHRLPSSCDVMCSALRLKLLRRTWSASAGRDTSFSRIARASSIGAPIAGGQERSLSHSDLA